MAALALIGISWSMPRRSPKGYCSPRAQSMYSANSALHYLFEGRFQQCKELICLALNQENTQLLLFIRGGVSAPCPVHLPISLGNKRWAEYRELSWTTPASGVVCRLPPSSIWHRKEEVFQQLEPNGRRTGFSLKQQSGNRINFHQELPQQFHITGGVHYLLPWISAFNYQDKHLEIFFFSVDNLEVSQKENYIYGWIQIPTFSVFWPQNNNNFTNKPLFILLEIS